MRLLKHRCNPLFNKESFWLVTCFILCGVVGLFTSTANAGDMFDLGELHFETVSTPEQIHDGLVTALAQDTRGFIWVGTQNGLFRYDGYQFRKLDKIMQDASASLGIFITSLYAAKDGRLWIGTLSGGASVYDPVTAKLRNWSAQPSTELGLSHNRVEAIVGDKAGNIWIGTNDGLDKIDGKTGVVNHYRHVKGDTNSLNNNHIGSLLIDNKDRLWVGSWNGLNRLKSDGNGFESVFSQPPPALSATPPLPLCLH
jgi:ligand-binding sensor domain-containing protein